MSSQPWMKFYPSDWRADVALRMCSPLARCLWIEMLCIMHEAEPRGYLLVRGRALDNRALAIQAGMTVEEVTSGIAELHANEVCGHDNGIVFSRKMVRESRKSEEQRDKAEKRWGTENKGKSDPGNANGNAEAHAENMPHGDHLDSRAYKGSLSLGRVRELSGDALADFSKTMAVASIHGLTGIMTGDRPCSLEDVEAGITQAAAWYRGKHGPGSMKNYDLAVKLSAENRDKRIAGAPPISEVIHDQRPDHRPSAANARQSRADASLDAAARVLAKRRAARSGGEGDAGNVAEFTRLPSGGG